MRLFYSLRPRYGCKVLWTACLHVCLFVRLFAFCLSACVSQNPHVQNSPNFLQMLLVAVARSFSDGIAICYVLPVLWMTSYFHIIQEICQNQRRHACFVHFARWRHQSDWCRHLAKWTKHAWRLRQRCLGCLVEIARWRHWRRSLSCCHIDWWAIFSSHRVWCIMDSY